MYLRRLKEVTKKTPFLRCIWDALKTFQKRRLFWDGSECLWDVSLNGDLSEILQRHLMPAGLVHKRALIYLAKLNGQTHLRNLVACFNHAYLKSQHRNFPTQPSGSRSRFTETAIRSCTISLRSHFITKSLLKTFYLKSSSRNTTETL